MHSLFKVGVRGITNTKRSLVRTRFMCLTMACVFEFVLQVFSAYSLSDSWAKYNIGTKIIISGPTLIVHWCNHSLYCRPTQPLLILGTLLFMILSYSLCKQIIFHFQSAYSADDIGIGKTINAIFALYLQHLADIRQSRNSVKLLCENSRWS